MKNRMGFISNSSSSSFIMDVSKTIDAAMMMMEVILREHMDSDDKKMYACEIARLEKVNQFYRENTGFDGNIMIPWSCNYETWIWREDGKILVTTCNNHDWDHYDLPILPGNESAEPSGQWFDMDEMKWFEHIAS